MSMEKAEKKKNLKRPFWGLRQKIMMTSHAIRVKRQKFLLAV